MKKLIDFLEKLESHQMHYKLDKIREGYILVEVVVPEERWEIEFGLDDDIVVERFRSAGDLGGEKDIDLLFRAFSS